MPKLRTMHSGQAHSTKHISANLCSYSSRRVEAIRSPQGIGAAHADSSGRASFRVSPTQHANLRHRLRSSLQPLVKHEL